MRLSVLKKVDRERILDKLRENGRDRMTKSRANRKLAISSIENALTLRIASELSEMAKMAVMPKSHILVKDVIDDLRCSSIKLTGIKEPINFGGNEVQSLRSMQNVANPREHIASVLDALAIVFPGCTEINVKVMKSEVGDLAQLTHTDFNTGLINSRVQNLASFHYSAIIALEPFTHLLVGKVERARVEIPVNSMLLFRGDCYHAGGAYPIKNSRIFISLSSDFCPLDKAVYLVK